MRKLMFLFVCLLLAAPCPARIIYVDDDGPADFNSIQSAIDSAGDGDTIVVQPGLYGEDINFLGKNITLTSTNPTNPNIVASTIIGYSDGNEAIVMFRGTEDPNCMLTGFNINGSIDGYDWSVDPFGENHTHATISNCLLQGNCGHCGTVIYACDGIISNCLVAENSDLACSGVCAAIPYPTIGWCNGLIKNCTIANNDTYYCIEVGLIGGQTTIENCIIYGNIGYQVFAPLGAMVNILYTDLQGGMSGILGSGIVNWGPGNIDTDPCFTRVGYWEYDEPNWILLEGDYHLLASSPCIDAGDPNYVAGPNETDLDGNPRIVNDRIDMGAYEFAPAIEALVKIRPRTLNLRSKGKWIMCRISLPEDYSVADIDPNSVFLEDEIPADHVWLQDEFAVVKFSRPAVLEMLAELETPAEVELLVSGELTDGTIFEGADVVRVIDKRSKKKSDLRAVMLRKNESGLTGIEQNVKL